MTTSIGRPAMTSPIHRPRTPSELGTGDLPFTIAAAFTALLPRLFVAIAWAREPVWDGHYYDFGARRIATGLGYSEDIVRAGHLVTKPWSHYPVGYSGLLGIVYKVFGSGLLVAPILNAVIGAAVVAVVHRLARYYVGEQRARVAAGACALHPGLIAYTPLVMTELSAGLLLLLGGFLAVHWRGQWRGTIAAGVVFGLATLVRPASILAAPLVALVEFKPLLRALGRGAAATAIAVAVVVPWTIRNCVTMDGCAFVSTNAGWNLAIGALTETGRFQTLRAKDGCPVVTGQVQQDRCWSQVARGVIARDPLHWLGLIPKKLSQTYDHESFAIEYLHEADPRAWPEARRVAARELLTVVHRLLLSTAALSVVGVVVGGIGSMLRRWRQMQAAQTALLVVLFLTALYALFDDTHPFYVLAVLAPLVALVPLPGAPRQGPAGRFLLGLLATTSLVHAVFFGDDRYHIVVAPVLCLLAAAALRSAEPLFRESLVTSRQSWRG